MKKTWLSLIGLVICTMSCGSSDRDVVSGVAVTNRTGLTIIIPLSPGDMVRVHEDVDFDFVDGDCQWELVPDETPGSDLSLVCLNEQGGE